MEFAERAARNEEIFRDVNEQIEKGAELHGVSSRLPFHCECARSACLEQIEIEPPVYRRAHAERYCFVVVHDHNTPQIERVVEEHEGFLVVEKIGEARAQIDRDRLAE